jgi:hypothetical protein
VIATLAISSCGRISTMIASQDLASFSRIPLKSSTVSSFSSVQMHLTMCRHRKVSCRRRDKATSYNAGGRDRSGADPERSPSLGRAPGPAVVTLGRANQFNLQLTKEARLISNLRWNMPAVVSDSFVCAAKWPSR